MPRATRSSNAAEVRAIVEPVASFYALLSTFPYLPASDILTPLAPGWPQRDTVNFRASDSVGHKLAALEGTADRAFLWNNALEPHGQKLDAHVLALTNGWQYGAWLLLDTEASTITDFSLLGGISSSIKCSQADRDAGLFRKHVPSKPLKEFFDDWKERYNSLEWMPLQDKNGDASGEIFSQKKMGTASKEPAEIRRIYTDHGWGRADFQKEECRKALSEWSKAWGRRILEEHDNCVKVNRPPPPDPLDDFSD
ncbi:MAG: hypothetical protein M1818_002495 [Claussenomyces sp. TS43310]|nr:MAG: hypothetical protein M1818_002495 [Claussenomyces sp. TS43310]